MMLKKIKSKIPFISRAEYNLKVREIMLLESKNKFLSTEDGRKDFKINELVKLCGELRLDIQGERETLKCIMSDIKGDYRRYDKKLKDLENYMATIKGQTTRSQNDFFRRCESFFSKEMKGVASMQKIIANNCDVYIKLLEKE